MAVALKAWFWPPTMHVSTASPTLASAWACRWADLYLQGHSLAQQPIWLNALTALSCVACSDVFSTTRSGLTSPPALPQSLPCAHPVPTLRSQIAVIEFARNVLKLEDANSTEFAPATPHPVVAFMPEISTTHKVGVPHNSLMHNHFFHNRLLHDRLMHNRFFHNRLTQNRFFNNRLMHNYFLHNCSW